MAGLSTLFEFEVPAEARNAFKAIAQHKLLDTERAIVPALREALYDWMRDVVDATIADTPLKARSGQLFNSLRKGVRVRGSSLDTFRGRYMASSFAWLHEYGGTIGPKNADVLAIPLPPALRPDGTPKLAYPRLWANVQKVFSYTSKSSGRGYLAYKGADGKLVLLYMFVDSATFKRQLNLTGHHYRMIDQLLKRWGDIMVRGMLSTNLYSFVQNPAQKIAWLESDVAGIRSSFEPVEIY